jgi:hypothetical protein
MVQPQYPVTAAPSTQPLPRPSPERIATVALARFTNHLELQED